MDFSLLEIDSVTFVILAEFISLRQFSVMSSILLINQPVDPCPPFRVLINLHPTTACSIPRVHKLAPNDSQSSNPFEPISLHQIFPTYSFPAIIPSPDKPFPLIEFLFFQDFWLPNGPIPPGFLLPNGPFYFPILDSSPFLLDDWTHDVFNVMSH